jgi:hypothetical protein
LVCHPIRRGESAADAARRVTGDSRNTYRASFQIMNASSKFIPKSQYERIRAGWQACVVKPPRRRAASVARRTPGKALEPVRVARASAAPVEPAAPIAAADADVPLIVPRAEPPAAADLPRSGNRDFTMVWLGAAIAAPWVWLQMLHVYRSRSTSTSIRIQHFADRFIDEFERPLLQYDGTERPLKSLVRRTRRGGFDILLAPGSGRRYPNLTDHKRNVEYDVARVIDALGDDAFVSGALSSQAEWVVVPFQSKPAARRAQIT